MAITETPATEYQSHIDAQVWLRTVTNDAAPDHVLRQYARGDEHPDWFACKIDRLGNIAAEDGFIVFPSMNGPYPAIAGIMGYFGKFREDYEEGCPERAYLPSINDPIYDCTLEIAPMAGSEKQVKWATDIITRPYRKMDSVAKYHERRSYDGLIESGKIALLIRKAMREYKNAYQDIADQLTASFVIARRLTFDTAMKATIQKVFREAGMDDKITEIWASLR